MKYIIIILLGISLFCMSFNKQSDIGKNIFENNCKSCHFPNKRTNVAPSFQNIRKDYGLIWTLAYLKNSRQLMNNNDVKALYSYYLFDKHEHVKFPLLETKYVIKVLDYVDRFPIDTLQFKHRLVSYNEKQKFLQQQILLDTIKPLKFSYDTLNLTDTINLEDTTQIQTERIIRRRTGPINK